MYLIIITFYLALTFRTRTQNNIKFNDILFIVCISYV